MEHETEEAFWRRLRQANASSDLLSLLADFEVFATSTGIVSHHRFGFLSSLFDSWRDLLSDTPPEAAEVIVTVLLPRCVPEREPSFPFDSASPDRLRSVLKAWLLSLPGNYYESCRDRSVRALFDLVDRADPAGVAWTLSVLGYRGYEVEAGCWRAGLDLDNESGDAFLCALTALSLERSRRRALVDAIIARLRKRVNITLLQACRRLADPRTFGPIADFLVRSPKHPRLRELTLERSLALRVFADTAEAFPDNMRLQARALNHLKHAFDNDAGLRVDELMASDLSQRCNTSLTVSRLAGLIQAEEPRSRFLAYMRLAECVLPRHVTPKRIRVRQRCVERLREDVVSSGSSASVFETQQASTKLGALNAALRLNAKGVLDWFPDAILLEQNPYTAGRVAELGACFTLTIPPELSALITDRRDFDGDTGDLALRLGALQMVSSAPPGEETLDVLRRSALTFRGQAFSDSGAALGEVAIALANKGVPSLDVIRCLVGDRRDDTPAARSTAANALAHLSSAHLVPVEAADLIWQTALRWRSSALEATRQLLIALSLIRGWSPPPQTATTLVEWASGHGASDSTWGAMEVLARQGLLVDYPDLMLQHLCLRRATNGWEFDGASQVSPGGLFIIAIMIQRYGDAFDSAAVRLLRDGEWRDAYPVIQAVRSRVRDGDAVSASIAQALASRLTRSDRSEFAEPEIFQALQEVSPEALVQVRWNDAWNRWLPSAQVALADAIRGARFVKNADHEAASRLLLLLAADGRFAVRRAAYRAMAAVCPTNLDRICVAWLAGDSPVELRRRGAEASGWVTEASWASISALALSDREVTVRNAAAEATAHRRKRGMATSYLADVLSVEDGNGGVLRNWGAGHALTVVGDDESLRTLNVSRRNRRYSPHVRRWHTFVATALGERWAQETKRWPDHWVQWDGAVESVDGVLRLPAQDGREWSSRMTLWHKPTDGSLGHISWGGFAPLELTESFQLMRLPKRLVLALANRAERTVAIQGITAPGGIAFVGLGDYPSSRG